MRRAATISVVAAVVVGLAMLATVAVTDERDLAFAFGVAPLRVAAVMQPGEEACQRPVRVAADFAAVRFQVGTFMRAGVPLDVSIRRRKRTLARGQLDGGYSDISQPVTRLDREIEEGEQVAVCIRNTGHRRIALFGGGEPAKERSGVSVDGDRRDSDLTLDFVRAEPQSAAATIPAMARRAGAFTAGWMATWMYWVVGALVLIGVPVCSVCAVRSAGSNNDPTAT